ncbi:MAG: DUF1249 domain-containing protein [Gammaproteobacteria bacterium]|nr:DUF1249 domain-containing protein [Gammaproteobacteria bacterium]
MNEANKKYVPDLSEFMSQCELNYALMMKCIRAAKSGTVVKRFRLDDTAQLNKADSVKVLTLTILDEARYTTTVNIELKLFEHPWLEPILFKVRVYHDAQLAEVLEPERNHAPKAKNPYPEQVRFYRDEKLQRNQMLGLCLTQCFNNQTDDNSMVHLVMENE